MIAPIPLVAPSRGSGAVWDGANVGADRGMDYAPLGHESDKGRQGANELDEDPS
jgi:hypothetical protein